MRGLKFLTISGLTILTAMIAGRASAQSQVYGYNQYAENMTAFNPAYSTVANAGNLSVIGRKQFVGINGAPTSLLFSGSLPIESINGAAGIFVLNDKVAVEQQTKVNAFFAKAIQMSGTGFLAVSINAGLRNYTADYSSLDANDPQFRQDVRETKPNLGFGVMYFTDNYYVGVSVPELTLRSLGNASEQDASANYLPNQYYFAAAYITDLNEDMKFKPATLIAYSKGQKTVANLSGTVYIRESLGVGLNYRSTNEVAGLLSVNVDTFRLGYSYQFNTASTNLGGVHNATHEVSLAYRFGGNMQRKLL